MHLDGLREEHDAAVCRDGVFDQAVSAIRAALARGFRVTTNTTLFDNSDPERTAQFFDFAMDLGVEGFMVSPGYAYAKAPDQEHWLGRQRTVEFFRKLLHRRGARRWRFNQSPLFIEFLAGAHDYECTPWGMPAYSIFGWQKPCYLIQDGYAESFRELVEETRWENYGPKSGNPACQNCMVHCGFEASAVEAAFSTPKGMLAMVRAMFRGPKVAAPTGVAAGGAHVPQVEPGLRARLVGRGEPGCAARRVRLPRRRHAHARRRQRGRGLRRRRARGRGARVGEEGRRHHAHRQLADPPRRALGPRPDPHGGRELRIGLAAPRRLFDEDHASARDTEVAAARVLPIRVDRGRTDGRARALVRVRESSGHRKRPLIRLRGVAVITRGREDLADLEAHAAHDRPRSRRRSRAHPLVLEDGQRSLHGG